MSGRQHAVGTGRHRFPLCSPKRDPRADSMLTTAALIVAKKGDERRDARFLCAGRSMYFHSFFRRVWPPPPPPSKSVRVCFSPLICSQAGSQGPLCLEGRGPAASPYAPVRPRPWAELFFVYGPGRAVDGSALRFFADICAPISRRAPIAPDPHRGKERRGRTG